jgi:hypothetical protein
MTKTGKWPILGRHASDLAARLSTSVGALWANAARYVSFPTLLNGG